MEPSLLGFPASFDGLDGCVKSLLLFLAGLGQSLADGLEPSLLGFPVSFDCLDGCVKSLLLFLAGLGQSLTDCIARYQGQILMVGDVGRQ